MPKAASYAYTILQFPVYDTLRERLYMIPRVLTFKNCPIEAQKNYEGFEIIVTYCQPNPYDLGSYFYYIRNSDLEILADNSKGYGERSIEDAIAQAKFTIEELM